MRMGQAEQGGAGMMVLILAILIIGLALFGRDDR